MMVGFCTEMLWCCRRGEVYSGQSGGGTGQIWLDNVRCDGNEDTISDCWLQHGWGNTNCSNSSVVWVSCDADNGLTPGGLHGLECVLVCVCVCVCVCVVKHLVHESSMSWHTWQWHRGVPLHRGMEADRLMKKKQGGIKIMQFFTKSGEKKFRGK